MACLKSINLQFKIVFNHNKNLAKQHKKIKHFTVKQHKNIGKYYNRKPNFQRAFPHATDEK